LKKEATRRVLKKEVTKKVACILKKTISNIAEQFKKFKFSIFLFYFLK
tara:strand:+ start:308 stop:451 length:144 start_codon:yes stop_codon:yes gene_type:complete